MSGIMMEEVVIGRHSDDKADDVPGLMYKCPHCDCNVFLIFELKSLPNHLHLQCINCSASFCDNVCGAH